jgi:hypothetical protein
MGWRAYEVFRLQAVLQISLLYLVGILAIGGHSRFFGARLLWCAVLMVQIMYSRYEVYE